MESSNCIICNSKNTSDYKQIKDIDDSNIFFNLVQCSCGLIFLNPRPDQKDISKYYNESYLPHTNKKNLFIKFYNLIQKITFFWKWRILKKNSYGFKTLLDIGSGSGDFCNYLKNKNITAITCDPYFNDKDNATLYEESSNSYDVITLWHSLEHVHDIKKIFSYIDSKLKSNGILYIAVPNHDAYERIYFDDSWIAYDVPRHLYHFTPKTLGKLLNLYDFDIVKKYSMMQDTFFNILLSKKMNIFRKIYILFKSIIIIPLNVDKSSSLLYVCKKK